MPDHSRMNDDFRARCFNAYQDLTQDGFIAVDRAGRILALNQKYADVLGIPVERALGREIREVIPITEMIELMEEERTDRDIIRFLNTSNLSATAKDRLVLLSRTAIRDQEGRVIGAVGYLRFYDQARAEFHKLEDVYTQISLGPEEVFQTAVEKTHSTLGEDADTTSLVDRLSLQLKYYQEEIKQLRNKAHPFVLGSAPSFIRVKNQAARIAQTNFSVLITGESGTGKEVIANLIHASSQRANRPLITINCAAIPAELLESELFGYTKGAFTGANREGKLGKFAAADGGSIFLDEIGDMPLPLQAKLLRVLENHEIEPVGATHAQKVDVRFISATRKDLEQMVAEGSFREDLYFRINELRLHLPPLRQRVEDIPLLARHMLQQINGKYGTKIVMSDQVIGVMKAYQWPGNIRELNNVIKGAYCMAENDRIDVVNLPMHITDSTGHARGMPAAPASLQEQLDAVERKLLLDALEHYNHNLNLVAKKLDLSRSTLYKKLAKHGIQPRG